MKREFANGLLGLASMLLLAGCVVVPTPTPYPTHTPYPTYTPQPTLGLPLSRYEGTEVSMMYPTGWRDIEEEPGGLYIGEPSHCGFIFIFWQEWELEISGTPEDRYRDAREEGYRKMLEYRGNKPDFEMLREYRLGDAPVFEYRYWDEEGGYTINTQIMNYIDLETHQYVIASWELGDLCGTPLWHQVMGFRRALFDTVMQSITLK